MMLRRTLPLLATLTLVSPAWAAKFTASTGSFIITCTSTGQICDPPQTLMVGDPVKALKVRKFIYTASAEHCSSGRVLIELDGTLIGRMRFVAGRETTTLRKKLRLVPGIHTFAFRIEGKVGGCNIGYVGSWGGIITVSGRRPGS